MNDDASSGGLSRLVWPGLIVLAVAVFGYKQSQPLLQSSRPKDQEKKGFPEPRPPAGLHGFYARLWEDPLLACYRDTGENEAPECAPAGCDDDYWFIRTFKKSLRLGLSRDPVVEDCKTTFTAILQNAPDKVLCLPVMVAGTPFGDDHEQRMRTAYAVHAALATSDYDLVFPTRMGYVDLCVDVSLRIDAAEIGKGKVNFRVPIKLFHRADASAGGNPDDKRPLYVVVLWINQDLAQDRPLNVISQIVSGLFEPSAKSAPSKTKWQKQLIVRILGPFDSNGLATIRKELTPPVGFRPQKGAAEESPAQTKSTRQQDESDLADYKHRMQSLSEFREWSVYSSRSTAAVDPALDDRRGCPRIHHIIGDDDLLASALIKELILRDAAKGKVVLLTERDTLYGARFGQLLREADPDGTGPHAISEVRFLRGIDGALPKDPSNAADKSTEPADATAAKSPGDESDDGHDPAPRGRAQKDYLARLEQHLVKLHDEERMKGEPGISAIGVVGSDVYDKLLILRALRKRFPKVTFFTTDLDAAFAKSEERATARNLVVASHFGLQLNPDLQDENPPFRDSYQTAMYYGTLVALKGDRTNPALRPDPWRAPHGGKGDPLLPLVFEIGLDGAYQITLTSDNTMMAAVHPKSPREAVSTWRYFLRAFWLWLAAIAISLCALVDLSAFRRAMTGEASNSEIRPFLKSLRNHIAAVSIVILAPLALILYDHLQENGQPFSIGQGISQWPATYLRYIAFCVAVALLYQTVHKLKKLTTRLDKEWEIAGDNPKRYTWQRFWQRVRTATLADAWTDAWKNLLVFNWPDDRHRHPQSTDPPPSATALYNDFAQRLRLPFILLRTVPLTVSFLLFGLLLTVVNGLPSNPYRGTTCGFTTRAVLAFASTAMTLLTFFVIDAMQLCRRFVGSLRNADLDWKSPELQNLAGKRGDKTCEWQATRALFTVQIIVECSNVVGKLITFPFIVVFLMVISRLPAFDYLDLNWILVALWVLLLGMACGSAFQLRKSAAKTRAELLIRLRDELSALAPGKAARLEQQRQAMSAIENETGGAFGSPLSDPLMAAIAIPFGGSTLILLAQQLLPHLIL